MARDGAGSDGRGEAPAVLIRKKVYVHDPSLPRSARMNTKSTIAVTNQDRVWFEKLQKKDQYDYAIKIDAAESLPQTWRHAGLPPDGMFAPRFPRYSYHKLRHLFTDYDRFLLLVTAACNLLMRELALSYHDLVQENAEVTLPGGRGLINIEPPKYTVSQWDALDEERMAHVLGMLVRLFYRGRDETGDRPRHEQELRKAVILYMGGTGGTYQFGNFANLFMSLELAVGFAESLGITWDDASHKRAARLRGHAAHWHGPAPVGRDSKLIEKCSKVLGNRMAGRICEYLALNNRLKHYGRHTGDAEYFNDSVMEIHETIRMLRIDAAYIILLGLVKLYEKPAPPALTSKAHHTSQAILRMIEDCVDRHGAGGVGGGVEEKIRVLREVVENDALKSHEVVYGNARSSLDAFEMLVGVAGMLDAPDGADGIRETVRKYEDILPKGLKPSEYGLSREYGENALHDGLVNIAHSVIVWMDGGFRAVYTLQHVARYGRTSSFRCDPAEF